MTNVYPQAKPFVADERDAFLERPLIAKLCSHNPDGTIHVAPMWFKHQDGEGLLGMQEITHKVRNIQHNSQVTLLIDTTEPTLQGVIMVGEAEPDYDDVIA
jgi:general stress protein 26